MIATRLIALVFILTSLEVRAQSISIRPVEGGSTVPQLRHAVVSVYVQYEGNCGANAIRHRTGGAAFAISRTGLWVTAAHVVRDSYDYRCGRPNIQLTRRSVRLLFPDGADCEVDVLAPTSTPNALLTSLRSDIAILSAHNQEACNSHVGGSYVIAKAPDLSTVIDPAQLSMTSVGYPCLPPSCTQPPDARPWATQTAISTTNALTLAQWRTIFPQNVFPHQYSSQDAEKFTITAPSIPGDSGGPLIQNTPPRLIGMISQSVSSSYSYAVLTDTILDSLQKVASRLVLSNSQSGALTSSDFGELGNVSLLVKSNTGRWTPITADDWLQTGQYSIAVVDRPAGTAPTIQAKDLTPYQLWINAGHTYHIAYSDLLVNGKKVRIVFQQLSQ